MKKILLAGHNHKSFFGTLEQSTEFWLDLGINHVMIRKTADTRFIENGKLVRKQFERFQKLQEKYGVKYHLHFYYTKVSGCALDISLVDYHPLLVELFIELDEKICEYNLYPLINIHPPILEKQKHKIKVDKRTAIKNGKEFFEKLSSMNLKTKIAIETTSDPYKDKKHPGVVLLGYKAKHFQKIIGDKNYGLCIDVGHLNMADEPLERFLELTYPIYSVHLHGNNGIRDDHEMATEDNIKNFETTRKMLKKVEGPVVLEILNRNYSRDDFESLFDLWGLK